MKKLLMLVLSVMLVLSMTAALASCKKDDTPDEDNGDKPEEKTTYTITIKDEDGAPIKDAKVTFKTASGSEMPFKTDAEGKASYKSKDTVKVTVTEIPSGYECDKLGKEQSFGADGTLSVTLKKLPPYVILVVDDEGNPIANVKVQMCDEAGSCRMPVTTDAEGKAYYPYEKGNFHAQLTVTEGTEVSDLYPGYTVDDPAEYYNFVDGVATIELTKE